MSEATARGTLQAPSALRFLLAAILLPALLAAMVLWLRTEYDRTEVLRRELVASYDRRLDQVSLLSRLKDAETAQRGYLLTGNPRFLAPYEPARAEIDRRLREGAADGFDRPYVRAIRLLVESKFAELDRTIALRRGGGGAEALRIVASGAGQADMDRLRALIGRRIAAEADETARKRSAFIAYRTWLQRVVYTVVLGLCALVFGTLLLLWRSRRQRHALLVDALEAGGRHATILDSTIDAILILNPSGTVETVNAAATRMLGYRADELERRDIGTILDLAPGEGSFHARIGLIDGQLRRSFLPDQSVRHRDGRTVAVDVAVGVMDVPSGVHLVVSLRDIAERKRLERVKDELISTVSHELRTPLTSVVGSLGLLRAGAAGSLPPEAGRLVDIAESNSRRLIRLINDMLDIDRIESGKLVMEQEPIDLRTVVEQACHGLEGLARAEGVALQCEQRDEPVVSVGDLDRLVQVVSNLVSNAVRAAPEGSAIDIALRPEGERAVIAVEDRGPGVPPAFRDRIFGRFERAERDDGAVGTGLGLAISREIVERHGGAIWFEDREGGGTRFAFSVPLAGTAAARDEQAPAVLVCVEDDRIAADLATLVVAEGCLHDRARSTDEARAALGRRRYAAMLVTLTLPEEGGLAFAQAARDGDPPHDGPIIVVAPSSANDGPGALDVVDCIHRSGPPERLEQALRKALSRCSARVPVILHLDDDRDLLDVVAAAIGPEARIIGATDLTTARAVLQNVSPDVVILDLSLADGSGLDLVPFLTDAEGLAIPTIIYSAQDISREDARGAAAVLVKARGSIPDLKATIRRVVRPRVARA